MGSGGGMPGGVSKFDGSNWINFNPTNSSIPSANVIDLDFDSQGNLWVATLNGLGKFDGSNWTVYRDTNSGLPTNALTNVEANSDTIWIGTQNSGVVKYDGQNWVTYNTQNSGLPNDSNSVLPSNTINAIASDKLGNTWIGTNSGIAIYNETGIVSVKNILDQIPNEYSLHQNFPNPFNPSTRIKFVIPKSGNVRLRVFDQLGREVRTLVNEELSGGSYEYELDGSGLASGVYFYRLETVGISETKKMLLVK